MHACTWKRQKLKCSFSQCFPNQHLFKNRNIYMRTFCRFMHVPKISQILPVYFHTFTKVKLFLPSEKVSTKNIESNYYKQLYIASLACLFLYFLLFLIQYLRLICNNLASLCVLINNSFAL